MAADSMRLSGFGHSAAHTGFLARALAFVAQCRRRARERHQLARMNAWLRRDLGLSETDVWYETSKPAWRA